MAKANTNIYEGNIIFLLLGYIFSEILFVSIIGQVMLL